MKEKEKEWEIKRVRKRRVNGEENELKIHFDNILM